MGALADTQNVTVTVENVDEPGYRIASLSDQTAATGSVTYCPASLDEGDTMRRP